MNAKDDKDSGNAIESDIYKFHDYLINNPDFIALKAGIDFTDIAITFVHDIKSWEYLIKEFSRIFFKKKLLHSRKAHAFLFEYSIRALNKHCYNEIELRKIEDHINMCISVNKRHNFNVEEVLQDGLAGDELRLFLTHKQMEQVTELKENMGFRSKGVFALVCMAWAFNETFRNRDFRYDKNEEKMDLAREWWRDDGIIKNIKEYMKEHERELRGYVGNQHAYLKTELDRAKQDKLLTLDKKRIDCVTKIIKYIEKKGFNK
jgi:hypothetical protein